MPGTDEAGDMLLPTHEFLEACGRCFRDVGAALAFLDIESDRYPVVCLRAARVEELTALAARAGFTARGFGVRSPGQADDGRNRSGGFTGRRDVSGRSRRRTPRPGSGPGVPA